MVAQPEQLRVRQIMTRNPATVGPDEPLVRVARLMKERRIGSVIIVEDDRVVGIVTERDIVYRAVERCEQWRSLTARDVMTSPVCTVTPHDTWAVVAEQMDLLQVRHLPVVEHGRLVGIVTARDLLHHRTQVLESAVRQRTRELEQRNVELTKRDQLMDYYLRMASRIQRQLLPNELPELPNISFATWYEPKDRVSGDFYDVRQMTGRHIGLLVCDASGHGIPAAFVSVMAQTVFRTCRPGSMSPAEVLSQLNEHLRTILEEERFITGCYGVFDITSARLRFAKAGHPPPLWYRADQRRVVPLDARGMLLGVSDKVDFEEVEITLEPGDRLVYYTDGLLETWSESGELLGLGRLRRWLAECGDGPAEQMVTCLREQVNRFRGRRPFEDDVTVLVLAYDGSHPESDGGSDGR